MVSCLQSLLFKMKHIILAVSPDPLTWESCRPFVEKLLAQVKEFYAQIEVGLWVFRTQECYSVVHELEHLFACRGIRFLSVPLGGPLPCGVTRSVGETLRALGVEVCNVSGTLLPARHWVVSADRQANGA
jgi:hypothetical protein